MEIIVVDNYSLDKTFEIAKSLADKVVTFGPERSAQRNYGVYRLAVGKYIIFLDADMMLSNRVFQECVNLMEEDDELVALYIPELIRGKSFFSKVRNFERSFYSGTVIDCVRFIRRDAFIAAGGFDEALTGPEDWDLDKRIRRAGKVALISSPLFHNESEMSLRSYLLKKKYYCNHFDRYIKKWGCNDPDIKKQFGIGYRYFGVFLENGKWKKFIKRPIFAISTIFWRLVLGLVYLKHLLLKRKYDRKK